MMTPLFAVVSDAVQIAFIAAVVSVVTSIPAILIALKTTNRKIDQLKENTDGKLSELMRNTSRADIAEGKAAGKAEEKLEAALIAGAKDSPEASQSATTTKEPALSLVAKDVTVTKKSL